MPGNFAFFCRLLIFPQNLLVQKNILEIPSIFSFKQFGTRLGPVFCWVQTVCKGLFDDTGMLHILEYIYPRIKDTMYIKNRKEKETDALIS